MTVKVPFAKGERLFVVLAGWKKCFLIDTSLLVNAKSATGDIKPEMYNNNFLGWVKENFVPYFPANSALVVDNAAYHNTKEGKSPLTTKKADTQAWLNTL